MRAARAWLVPGIVVGTLLVTSAVLWWIAGNRPSAERQPWIAAAASTLVAATTFLGSLLAQDHSQRLAARAASVAQLRACYVDFAVAAAEYAVVLVRRRASEARADRITGELRAADARGAVAESAGRAADELDLLTKEAEARRLALVGMVAKMRSLGSTDGDRPVAEAAEAVLDSAGDDDRLQQALKDFDLRLRDHSAP